MGMAVKLLEPITWQTATDGLGRVVVVRLRKARCNASKTLPRTVVKVHSPQMKEDTRIALQLERLAKTKGVALFRSIFPRPELWKQVKEAISLLRIEQVARAICRWARRQHLRVREWVKRLPRIPYSHARELPQVENTSAPSEE